MAKNALFHKTLISTGHGSHFEILPAQRQQDVISCLQTDLVKIEVDSSMWLPVKITMNASEVYFTAGDGLDFHSGDFGFDYLVNQLNPEYNAALNYFYEN